MRQGRVRDKGTCDISESEIRERGEASWERKCNMRQASWSPVRDKGTRRSLMGEEEMHGKGSVT